MQKKHRSYDRRWQKARSVFLRQNPICVKCLRSGQSTPATVVDHITPHNGDPQLFWDKDNWQPLCASCHSGVKAIEDGVGYSQAADKRGFPMDAKHPWNMEGGRKT